jgi:DNA-binding winged helix-turn-helix (wHTH) protein/Tol biopolymer transport system component
LVTDVVPHGAVQFGRFELDLDAGRLTQDGHTLRIQPQPLRVLCVLVEHAGDVVTRETLRAALWDQSTFVEFDQGLNYCIRQIRVVLRDDASKPIYIETIKRTGYRFAAPVAEAPSTSSPGRISTPEPAVIPAPVHSSAAALNRGVLLGASAVVMLVILLGASLALSRKPTTVSRTYRQLTDFADIAFSPALSPDGSMVAFIVGNNTSFPPVGEVYTKLLPNGEPVQLTHDGWPKYGVTFSPDGLQVSYTVADIKYGWSSYAVSPLGGEPRLLRRNASGLAWLDDNRALFSEIKSGLHMGLVSGVVGDAAVSEVYLPEHERGMAHFGIPSPDRKSALVIEMGPNGAWARCRVVPMDGRASGRQVGPSGACTGAAWSSDGSMMYFTAVVDQTSHIWRQRYPNGEAEQVTFGPAEEDGLAISPGNQSIVTSAGMKESGIWLHDQSGDRLIANKGTVSRVSFSRDGRQLYFLLRRAAVKGVELWTADLGGHSRPLVSDRSITGFDVSSDGTRVVFAVQAHERMSELWLAPADGSSPPRMLTASGEDSPFFGPDGDVIFRATEGRSNYLFRMAADGSDRRKVSTSPVIDVKRLSPDRRWAIAMIPVDGVPSTVVAAIPVDGGALQRICIAQCMADWSPDGSRFYVEPFLQSGLPAAAIAMRVPSGQPLPELPKDGIASVNDGLTVPGSHAVDMTRVDLTRDGTGVAPGPEPDSFVYARTIVHRNLFEIRIP